MTPKAQATKVKMNKLNVTKIKNFCASRYAPKKVERQPTEWKKIITSLTCDENLEFRKHRLLQ